MARAGGTDLLTLRREVEQLCSIYRPSASEGEREAAQWAERNFQSIGLHTRIEEERAQGGYWLPLGLAQALAAAGGIAALRGKRRLGGLLATLGAAAVWDDTTVKSRFIRWPLPKRDTFNVIAELGPEDAEKTVVYMAHHDSAHSGLIFSPAIPKAIDRHLPGLIERSNTSPPLMWSFQVAPALVGLGAAVGSRKLATAGTAAGAVMGLLMAEVAARKVVPGANDNASGVVALFEVARMLAADPPPGMRFQFVSCGAEESLEEGSYAFGKRHFKELAKDRTFFINIDGVGSSNLLCLEGEGMMKMYEYPQRAKELAFQVADDLGVELVRGMRMRNSTDGLVPLRAGYQTVSICSMTDQKQPINYHWPTDTPDVLTYSSIHDAARVAAEMARRLSVEWIN